MYEDVCYTAATVTTLSHPRARSIDVLTIAPLGSISESRSPHCSGEQGHNRPLGQRDAEDQQSWRHKHAESARASSRAKLHGARRSNQLWRHRVPATTLSMEDPSFHLMASYPAHQLSERASATPVYEIRSHSSTFNTPYCGARATPTSLTYSSQWRSSSSSFSGSLPDRSSVSPGSCARSYNCQTPGP